MLTFTSVWYNFTIESYKKLKNIYSRRKGFYNVEGIGEVLDLLHLPLDSKWYRYKDRIFIFRPKQKIASFVIAQYDVYCPAKCFSEVTSIIDHMYEMMSNSKKEYRRIQKQRKKRYKSNDKLQHSDLHHDITPESKIIILYLITNKFRKRTYVC